MLKRILFIFILTILTLQLSACQSTSENPDGKDTGADSADASETMNENQTGTYLRISMEEAVTMMQEESGYIILDVRRADEFAGGHIPGAINVANEDIGTAEIPELPDKDQLIMVYCRSGRRSKEASEKLAALGYTNIVEFGGILDWTGEISDGE
ncbi:MAG: rhodanese-like domain-containing protein [Clostridia bacterium]|nr:rhodanese-like domain-containing protein [Clostridia bacterium]